MPAVSKVNVRGSNAVLNLNANSWCATSGRLVSPVFFDMLFALHMCQDFNITLFVVLFGQCLPWQRHCVL